MQSARSFDVICTGGPRWIAASSHVSLANDPRLQLHGAVSVAAALAGDRLHVTLTSELPDNTHSRALLASLNARSVEVSTIELATPAQKLVFVKNNAHQDLSVNTIIRPLHVPST